MVLIEILFNCLLFKDVSPYQTKGDVKSASNFFGRVEIVGEIISHENINYLILKERLLEEDLEDMIEGEVEGLR